MAVAKNTIIRKKQVISGIQAKVYLTSGVNTASIPKRDTSCHFFGFATYAKMKIAKQMRNKLHKTGDKKFHPNNNPHRTHGNKSTGLHAANDKYWA